MNAPRYQPNEPAIVGPYPTDASLARKPCTIVRAVEPIAGAHRYLVVVDGRLEIVLEQTLRKVFQRSDWGMLRGIWQPKRVAR